MIQRRHMLSGGCLRLHAFLQNLHVSLGASSPMEVPGPFAQAAALNPGAAWHAPLLTRLGGATVRHAARADHLNRSQKRIIKTPTPACLTWMSMQTCRLFHLHLGRKRKLVRASYVHNVATLMLAGLEKTAASSVNLVGKAGRDSQRRWRFSAQMEGLHHELQLTSQRAGNLCQGLHFQLLWERLHKLCLILLIQGQGDRH
mmetsp:Transcript_37358/g.74085  ORF Transcript_37358/g.74085 Transcript_37358/m.74085 type:complete len:201 (-) Transcript_37358:470-1072(-)